MTTIQAFQYKSGDLRPYALEANSYDEALAKAGRGTYTVFLIYPGNKVLHFEEHTARLRRSAGILKMPFSYRTDTLREVVGLALRASSIQLPRVCLMVPSAAPDTILLMLQEFTPPGEEIYKQGVQTALAPMKRSKPSAKDSGFIPLRKKIRQQHPDAHEILMYNEKGQIQEGLSSNFFALLNGELRTAGENVLPGITRSILLEAAQELMPVRLEPILLSDLTRISEAFLTSSSRGVLPVVQIGSTRIGSGKPGAVYNTLRKLFEAHVEAELEPIDYDE